MANNIFFPYALAQKVAFNGQRTPSWGVTEQKTASGQRRTLVTQLLPTVTYTYTFPCLSDDEVGTLLGFFNQRKGTAGSFFFSDWLNDVVTDVQLARDETKGTYQLYAPSGNYIEQIFYASEIKVYVNGAEVTGFTHSNGVLTIPSASSTSTVKASYRAYHKVHFKDSIVITDMYHDAHKVTMKLETTL